MSNRNEPGAILPESTSHSSPEKSRVVVGIIDHTATLGGGEIALLNLVKHLDTERFAIIVILSADGPLVERLRASGIDVHVLPLAPSVLHTRKDSLGVGSITRVRDILRMIQYSGEMAGHLRRHKIELVHTNSLKADILGGIAARLAGIPVIWHVRDRIEKDYLPAPVVAFFRCMCRIIPNYIVANSQATLQTLHLSPDPGPPTGNYIHTRPSGLRRARVVHDGTPIPETPVVATASPHTTGAVDRPIGATGDSIHIGLVGRISPWKGQHIFLRAVSLVHRRFPEARFSIIGAALFSESDYEADVRQLVDTLGLAGYVEFTGFCDDILARISALDILVHASTVGEPFGQVIIEGMVCGKPIVATKGGGVPEIVEDGISGLLVPMSDADAMAEAIIRLLERPEMAQEMGKRAYSRVVDHFRIDLTARRMEEVYTDLVRPQNQ